MKKLFLRLAWLFGIIAAIAAICLVNSGFNFILALVIELAGIITAFLSWGKLKHMKAESQWIANRKKIHRLEYRDGFRGENNA